MCSPSFTAITSGRDSVQQARQLQSRIVALNSGMAADLCLSFPNRMLIRRYTYDPKTQTLGSPVDILKGLPSSHNHQSARLLFGPDAPLNDLFGASHHGGRRPEPKTKWLNVTESDRGPYGHREGSALGDDRAACRLWVMNCRAVRWLARQLQPQHRTRRPAISAAEKGH